MPVGRGLEVEDGDQWRNCHGGEGGSRIWSCGKICFLVTILLVQRLKEPFFGFFKTPLF